MLNVVIETCLFCEHVKKLALENTKISLWGHVILQFLKTLSNSLFGCDGGFIFPRTLSCCESTSWKWLPAQFIIGLGWEECEFQSFSGWNGIFVPSSRISLWVSSAVSAVTTQKQNSVKTLCFLGFFPQQLAPPPFPLMNWHCWKKHMPPFPLPNSFCCLNMILLSQAAVVYTKLRVINNVFC